MRPTVVLLSLVIPLISALKSDEDTVRFLQGITQGTEATKATEPVVMNKTCVNKGGISGVCVMYYQCDTPSRKIIDDGKDIFDLRKGDDDKPLPCPNDLEVCCQPNSVSTTPMPVQKNLLSEPHKVHETVSKNTVFAGPRDTCGWNNPTIRAFRTKNAQVAENLAYANYGDFPFMIAILKRRNNTDEWTSGDYVGGATLIHHKYVMTAAHKVEKYSPQEIKCRAGEYDTQTTLEQFLHQERNVQKIIIHESYYRTSLFYDVAILALETPFNPTPHIGLACLAKTLPPADQQTTCFSMGWGKEFKKNYSNAVLLKKVKLTLIDSEKCTALLQRTRLGPFFRVNETLTCAGGEEGVDTCRGDGGSPLVCTIDSDNDDYIRYAVYGMVAYGIKCGAKDVPSVYVNVPYMHDWIEEQMKKENAEIKFNY